MVFGAGVRKILFPGSTPASRTCVVDFKLGRLILIEAQFEPLKV
jgi:hypothetical protein